MTTASPDINTMATEWLNALATATTSGDPDAVADLFEEDGYWRDLLSFTWNLITA